MRLLSGSPEIGASQPCRTVTASQVKISAPIFVTWLLLEILSGRLLLISLIEWNAELEAHKTQWVGQSILLWDPQGVCSSIQPLNGSHSLVVISRPNSASLWYHVASTNHLALAVVGQRNTCNYTAEKQLSGLEWSGMHKSNVQRRWAKSQETYNGDSSVGRTVIPGVPYLLLIEQWADTLSLSPILTLWEPQESACWPQN